MKTKYIIFDLDDTLAYEIDYLKSAYKEIAENVDKVNSENLRLEMLDAYHKGLNVFEILIQKYPISTKEGLLNIYRTHFPDVQFIEGANDLLDDIKNKGYKIGLITDGRSITQRNKLKALGIEGLFDLIIISEEFGSSKPDERNYKAFIVDNIAEYFYIADNPKKDFLTPNKLGWTSICLLDKGNNIHPQNFDLETDYVPKIKVDSLKEIIDII